MGIFHFHLVTHNSPFWDYSANIKNDFSGLNSIILFLAKEINMSC